MLSEGTRTRNSLEIFRFLIEDEISAKYYKRTEATGGRGNPLSIETLTVSTQVPGVDVEHGEAGKLGDPTWNQGEQYEGPRPPLTWWLFSSCEHYLSSQYLRLPGS